METPMTPHSQDSDIWSGVTYPSTSTSNLLRTFLSSNVPPYPTHTSGARLLPFLHQTSSAHKKLDDRILTFAVELTTALWRSFYWKVGRFQISPSMATNTV